MSYREHTPRTTTDRAPRPLRTGNLYDVIVVGARAAGAATAMLLARGGLRTLLLDQSAEGSDTLSTHALMRAGVLQLSRWGVLREIIAAGTPPVRRVSFRYGDEKLVENVTSFQQKLADQSNNETVHAVVKTQVDLTRQLTAAYTSAAREFIA